MNENLSGPSLLVLGAVFPPELPRVNSVKTGEKMSLLQQYMYSTVQKQLRIRLPPSLSVY